MSIKGPGSDTTESKLPRKYTPIFSEFKPCPFIHVPSPERTELSKKSTAILDQYYPRSQNKLK